MSVVLSATELVKGKKADPALKNNTPLLQPLQFIPRGDKTEDWCKNNADFQEWQGLRQIIWKAPKFAKNYNLAQGIIDKSDYIPSTAPENKDLLTTLMVPDQQDSGAFDLRFYPMIPSFINTLCTEFSQRNTKLQFMTADEYSYNEMLELKQNEIGEVLLKEAEGKIIQKFIEMGGDESDQEQYAQLQQQLAPENLKTLPGIQEYYDKNYRSMIIEWASHQHKEDCYRFSMDELEERNFRNSLITDSEYWHFIMKEDDYDIEIWNPMFTYVHKSPETRFTSSAYAAGNIRLMTIPDVINEFGRIMSEEQQKSLERIYPAANMTYPITGYANDSYYDNTKSVDWNMTGPSLGMRQNVSMAAMADENVLNRLMNPIDIVGNGENYVLRVSTGYWKSMRRVGHLTRVKPSGEVDNKIVDESYVVTDHPVYNNILISNRNTDTLIFGEHIEWTWIPQVFAYTKIGPNIPSYWGMPPIDGNSGLQPMYLGIGQNKIGPVKYQFKGEKSLYGCKIPVEGATFSDYNTPSTCAVDLLKPYQIGYNVALNRVADLQINEIGNVLAIDPNQIPKHSLGEEWGKHNYSKFTSVMRSFGLAVLDRSLANTESAGSGNSEPRVLNLVETERLLTNLQLAAFFKNEGLSQMGITPQRLGQPTGRKTATGVQEDLQASYNQTETYITQHSLWLMPRVHQMRTDLAQFYQSRKPSVRLQYMTSKEEKVWFEINGTDLLLRDINIYPVSSAYANNIMEQLKQKLLQDNNTDIEVLGPALLSDSISELGNIFEGVKKRQQDQKQQEYNEGMRLQQQKDQAALEELRISLDHEAREAELDRRKDILVAEIRAAGYSGSVDLNENQQNDYMDNLALIQGQTQFQEQMNLKREDATNKTALARDKATLEREKMNTQLRSKQLDLEIARENQTSAELKKHHEKKKKEREAKKKKK